jgi:hypothetical protein
MSPQRPRLPKMRALITAVIVWLTLIALASLFGGVLSLYTGHVSEIPKWNGWSYFFFSVREIGLLGAILTLLIGVIVFFLNWASSGPRDAG